MLDELIDEIGEQETHPLADLVETLALAITAYEEVHVPVPASSGLEILRALMEDHGLSQSDLPEVGSQGVVSEVLSGKRDLNVRQIVRLAARFGVSPAVFLQMPTPANRPSRRKQVLIGKK
jgi:HTH-type transcriptional regulator/antitoxin HigA